ncbi:fibronectin type III domain-containing protein [Chitinophaga sp.]|uniref:fibronectin type III domain-containing protein n=1 Tax=Chitinophaga sp. TaxID=1869181 RepID=UPI0031D9DB76
MKQLIPLLILTFTYFTSSAQCGPATNLKSTVNGTSVKLDWDAIAGASKYAVEYQENGDILWTRKVVTVNTFTVDSLSGGKDYNWRVICTDAAGTSGPSATSTFKIAGTGAGFGTGTSGQTGNEGKAYATVAPDLSINFAGPNTNWGNINPVVNFGINKEVLGETGYLARWKKSDKTKKISMRWLFQFGPYMGSQFPIKDSTGYLPALFLPGSGIQINNFFTFPANNEGKFSVTFSPLNLGVKVMSGFTDSTVSIIQHSIRSSILLDFWNIAQLTVQYTQGWHNLSTSSEEHFKEIFKTNYTNFSYITATIGAKITNLSDGQNNTPLYFVFRFQSVAGNRFKGELPNRRIVGFGLLANLDFRKGTHPGLMPMAPRN